jgi:hypothetical protein
MLSYATKLLLVVDLTLGLPHLADGPDHLHIGCWQVDKKVAISTLCFHKTMVAALRPDLGEKGGWQQRQQALAAAVQQPC